MNAVEIEQAISDLALQPFDPAEFAYAFLEAFGNKATTLKKLRSGTSNKSDLGGVLQTRNIHIAVAEAGAVTQMLTALKDSPATSRAKARFILATDGESFEAEDLDTGETVACSYQAFPDHFGFFLPLAGITTVKQLRDSSFDIRATSRLNRLYVELLKDNPAWGTEEQRHEMNHFMARLIFCFFAEDTDIFSGSRLFTDTVAQMSARDSANTHEVISEIFRAMNTKQAERAVAGIPRWADAFPYVNGGLFSGSAAVPEFSKIARSYLLHIGGLDWTQINPDIFGSMIQAVADDEERGALGMHYTSVPNILKVLNPLFLDDLRAKLEEAGDNSRKLLNLRNRMARIRIFDPACGSGNFLVIAYKQMREIEAEINQRRGEGNRPTDIPLTSFRGIELRNFSAEIARLALIIAEYQCNVQYRGKQLALNEFLPLSADNWITCGNALRLDWLAICPPIGTGVKVVADDLFETPLDQAQIDFENEGGETYICGNPPYKGSQDQTPSQKADLAAAFAGRIKSTKSADYVSGWFILARDYMIRSEAVSAFVTTNSLNQGRQVSLLWPAILSTDLEIRFARPSFLWSNLASKKAAVTVSIVGLGKRSARPKLVFTENAVKQAAHIGPYLVPDHTTVVSPSRSLLSSLSPMTNGSMPNDGGGLLLDADEYRELVRSRPAAAAFCRKFLGSHDSIQGETRYCLWIADVDVSDACAYEELAERVQCVRVHRENSGRPETNALAFIPHSFGERRHQEGRALLIPRHSSESRPYLPSVPVNDDTVIGDSAIAMYDFTLPDVSIYSSRLHLVWIATVCGKIKEDYRYSNSLGWNTFPVPTLTEKNKADLTRCAEDILLAREAHFPATIADLYNPETMPDNLRAAHERNDEVLERIYIGRRFKNDTERLEKLFELYTKMTDKTAKGKKA
ncbi:lactate dehydrogenase [Alcaligenaceae bacterium CGII-47]|nr:lactate dehydrogenase [Alcaligenaceae bacterium CGII-47]